MSEKFERLFSLIEDTIACKFYNARRELKAQIKNEVKKQVDDNEKRIDILEDILLPWGFGRYKFSITLILIMILLIIIIILLS
jgi:hypothetical protein